MGAESPKPHQADMPNVLKRVYYGVRAIALIPLMIIAGLVLYLHDRISRLLKDKRMGSRRRS